MQVLLDGQQDLHRVDRLDEVVGDLAADGLVHDVLFLALGNHDDGHIGLHDFDALQGHKAADTRHVLVEDDEVEDLAAQGIEGVTSVGDRFHLVALVLEEQDVGLQQVDFVVGPQNSFFTHAFSIVVIVLVVLLVRLDRARRGLVVAGLAVGIGVAGLAGATVLGGLGRVVGVAGFGGLPGATGLP